MNRVSPENYNRRPAKGGRHDDYICGVMSVMALCHYADQRISLDRDDGVKVNYGKFGDLLAEVNTVTGGASE